MIEQTAIVAMVTDALKELRKSYARHIKWHAQVDAYVAAGYTREAEPKMKCPSKTSKHQMYATADRVIRLLDLNKGLDAGQSLRPGTLGEIGTLIQIATVELAKF